MEEKPGILAQYPKLHMSLLPTPVHRLDRISRLLAANIYCKRDDLTGLAFGGNKTRKLDFLIADAMRRNADTLIAIGANQSNFCRMAAAAGVINGLETHLVLGGEEPEKPTGNLLVDHLLAARIRHVASDDWGRWIAEAELLREELTAQGRNVYLMPIGGSSPIGALGYVAAFFEILADFARMGQRLDVIVLACSSGGSQAGYLVGRQLFGWSGQIIGMGVAKDREALEREIFELAQQTAELLDARIDRASVVVDDHYLGETYGAGTVAGEAAIRMFAEHEGILLDRVYTGKAAAGLIDYAARGRFADGANVLFVHTGGNIELFE